MNTIIPGKIITLFFVIFLVAYSIFFSVNQINQHRCFLNPVGHDTAGYNQTVWNTLHGNLFNNTICTMKFNRKWVQLGDHFCVIILFILPFYVFHQTYELLLILQTAAIAGTAYFLYLISYQQLKERGMGLIIAVAFLSAPMLMRMYLYGVRPEYYSCLLMFGALYCLLKRKILLYFILFGMALLCKESIPLAGMALGVYIFFNRAIVKYRMIGIITIIISIVYFIVVTRIIMPPIRVGGYMHDVSKTAGRIISEEGWKELKNNFLRLDKPRELYEMFRPMFVLPFMSSAAILIVPGLVQSIVKALSWNVWNHILLVPYIYLASIFGALSIKRKSRIAYNFSKVFVCVSVLFFNILPSVKTFHRFKPTEINLYLHNLKNTFIPEHASIITQMHMTPDFSSRPEVYWLDFKEILTTKNFEEKDVDYMFFGCHRAYSEHGRRELISIYNFIGETKKYRVIVADKGYVILKKYSDADPIFSDTINRQLAHNWLQSGLRQYQQQY